MRAAQFQMKKLKPVSNGKISSGEIDLCAACANPFLVRVLACGFF
jgi:hypothetical protein